MCNRDLFHRGGAKAQSFLIRANLLHPCHSCSIPSQISSLLNRVRFAG